MAEQSSEFLPPDLAALSAAPAAQEEAMPPSPLAAAASKLMERPGVVMAGETVDAIGRAAILVGVRQPKDLANIPREIDGIPVVVQVIGEVKAQ